MSASLYILTDGLNSKIGVTLNWDKRRLSYVTHNPNFQLYKIYSCDLQEARRVESHIKTIFRDRISGESTEWFKVSAEHIDRYITNVLYCNYEQSVTPAEHGVSLSEEGRELKEQIKSVLWGKVQVSTQVISEQKDRMAEAFAISYGLGVPEHRLPEHVLITHPLSIDFQHCDINSGIVCSAVRNNQIILPHDDHIWKYYYLLRLSSGHFLALCTSRVSMPYLSAIKGKKMEIVTAGEQLGWNVTFHDDWSWHYPEKTALVLFQQKTPVCDMLNAWNCSFRKWVTERANVLKSGGSFHVHKLEAAVDHVLNDVTFPLGVTSYQELLDKYLCKFWDDETYYLDLKEVYEFLFKNWHSRT